MTDLITRAEAQQQGLKRYYTGVPCKYGHVVERYAANQTCVACALEQTNARYAANTEEYRVKNKANSALHRGSKNARNRAAYAANPEVHRARSREWHAANPEASKAKSKAWYDANPDAALAWRKAYAADNAEAIKSRTKAWQLANKNALRAYQKNRYQSNAAFAVTCRLRVRLYAAVRGSRKSASTMELIGCTREELMAHLEAQFTEGMSWENMGEWQIDHRLPCAAFDMLDPLHQRACAHYTNLQPLWSVDNIRKGDHHDPAEVAAWVARFS